MSEIDRYGQLDRNTRFRRISPKQISRECLELSSRIWPKRKVFAKFLEPDGFREFLQNGEFYRLSKKPHRGSENDALKNLLQTNRFREFLCTHFLKNLFEKNVLQNWFEKYRFVQFVSNSPFWRIFRQRPFVDKYQTDFFLKFVLILLCWAVKN